MPGNSRIQKLNLMSHVSNQKEKNHSSHGAMHEVGREYRPSEFAMLPDTAIAAMFAPHKAWLRMLHEHNWVILNTYREVFWFSPSLCLFPLELAHRTFAAHIECHQYIIEFFEQQSKAANFSGLRIERTHSVILEPVDSIEHAMDIAIGAGGNRGLKQGQLEQQERLRGMKQLDVGQRLQRNLFGELSVPNCPSPEGQKSGTNANEVEFWNGTLKTPPCSEGVSGLWRT
jgi:hypothetical protein